MTSSAIISKIWSFCTTLRDDGVSYGEYLEQLTYLLFLKMADEYRHTQRRRFLARACHRTTSPLFCHFYLKGEIFLSNIYAGQGNLKLQT